MTTAMEASSVPPAIESINACRLLPRPEIRTPRRRLADTLRVTDRRRFASDDFADHASIVAAARRELVDERFGVIASGDDDQPNAHIERPQHVVLWNAAAS